MIAWFIETGFGYLLGVAVVSLIGLRLKLPANAMD
jgi:hypothetical protein